MGAPKPFEQYPTRTAAVLAMRERGMTRYAVARRLGIREKDVSALECSARRSADSAKSFAPGERLLKRARVHASRRGITTTELCRRLIDRVLEDDIVDAVLDDREVRDI